MSSYCDFELFVGLVVDRPFEDESALECRSEAQNVLRAEKQTICQHAQTVTTVEKCHYRKWPGQNRVLHRRIRTRLIGIERLDALQNDGSRHGRLLNKRKNEQHYENEKKTHFCVTRARFKRRPRETKKSIIIYKKRITSIANTTRRTVRKS